MSQGAAAGPREPWCTSLAGASLASLRGTARALDVTQLKRYGYDYCYLNLLTVLGERYSNEQLAQFAADCMRNHLLWGEEFHAYCLAARGERPWDEEIQELHAGIQLTARAKPILRSVQEHGGMIACGFHSGAFRFIPFALSSLGMPVKLMLGESGIGKYGKYFEYGEGAINEMRRRGVPESFYGVTTIGTHHEAELLKVLRSLRTQRAALFIPVDGMFTTGASNSTVEVALGGVTLQVKANPARLSAVLRVPLVALSASRLDSGDMVIDVVDVVQPNSSRVSVQRAMEQLYRSLEERIIESPWQWEGARTFHKLRKPVPASAPAKPTEEDVATVLRALEGGSIALNRSRLAWLENASGRGTWIDCRTLQGLSGNPEVMSTLNALSSPVDAARLWQQVRNDIRSSELLIQFLAQLQAAGALRCSANSGAAVARVSPYTNVWPDKYFKEKGGEKHEPRAKERIESGIQGSGLVA